VPSGQGVPGSRGRGNWISSRDKAKGTEVGGRRAQIRGRRAEIRCQRSEGQEQETEGGEQSSGMVA